MRPYKDFVRHNDHTHPRRTDTTDEDIVSGMIAMVVLGGILGLIMGLAI